MRKIIIKKPGLLTTIQDLGRYGYQKFGMPVSGAMDAHSLKLANNLVGNPENEAGLEATAIGPEIEFDADIHIAICGANFQPLVNGNYVKMYSPISIKSGDVLSFKGLINGLRTYISFRGGIEVPVVMGSKSTYLRGKIGGLNGRQLKKDDIIKLGICEKETEIKEISQNKIPNYLDSFIARIIPGPEAKNFTTEGLADFLNKAFILSKQCDRMGYRLTGNKIKHKISGDIISSGINFGTIQVPSHGDPIILMADRQSTGGYARIANIITKDLTYVAQLKPGDHIRFKEVSLGSIQ